MNHKLFQSLIICVSAHCWELLHAPLESFRGVGPNQQPVMVIEIDSMLKQSDALIVNGQLHQLPAISEKKQPNCGCSYGFCPMVGSRLRPWRPLISPG